MRTSVCRSAMMLLAGLGTIASAACLMAGESSESGPALPPRRIVDIRLGSSGSLSGHIVDREGTPVVTTVSLRQGGRPLADTVTDDRGAFHFEQVPGGVHELAVLSDAHVIRVWDASTAPPVAQASVVVVVSEPVVRGQDACDEYPCDDLNCDDCCYYEGSGRKNRWVGRDGLLWGATAVTGLVLGAVALGEIDDLEDQLDRLISP